MTPEMIKFIMDGGEIAVLVLILIEGAKRFDALTATLKETNERVFKMLERELSKDDDLTASQIRRINPPLGEPPIEPPGWNN